MGRPSKLTPAQWDEIHRRLLKGEKTADLAREFNISKTRISERFSGRFETVQSVANQILTAEQAFQALPVAEQIETVSILNDLRAVSQHLASAAKFGAATAHRVAMIANRQLDKLDEADPLADDGVNTLRVVSAMTEVANKAGQLGIGLLQANKETVKEMNQQAKPLPQRVMVTVEDASVPDA